MRYDVSFGRLAQPPRAAVAGKRFRLAVMGDFSGRANAGLLETGPALARRKPIAVDVDNLDAVLAKMSLSLSLRLAEDEALVSVPIGSMDDFHPDQLVENVELFESLLALRRNLASKTSFARAAKEVLSWSGAEALESAPRGPAGAVPADKRLSDFARLTGRKPAADAEADVDALLRRLVGPYVQPAKDPRQEELTKQVDAALSAAMRRVLHHPDFQAAEAVWRGVELLVRNLETGARLQIVLYDVSAEELAADLAAGEALEQSGLYGLLVEQPAMDADAGPFAAVVGLYGFELSPPHADLLGRMAQVAAASGAPFLAGIDPDALQTPMHEQHPLIRQAWSALWALPAATYLGLAAPRFLLRQPYGKRSDPIDAFTFEEFTRQSGLSGMLWANAALAPGLLLAKAWEKNGAKMKPGDVSVIGAMPYYVYVAEDGDQTALPCTERHYSERQSAQAASLRVMPVVSLRGRPEIRLAGVTSMAGSALAGFWAPVAVASAAAPAVPAAEDGEPADPASADAGPGETASSPDVAPAEPDAAADEAAPAEDDLDALLASLSAPAPAADEAATEPDLDALLASL